MKDLCYNFHEHPHFDEYNHGACPPHHEHHHPHHHHPHHHHHCHGKVGIVGRLVLSVKYIDHHGHVQYFDVTPGETYIIEAISQIKGKCRFAGRIVDFDSTKGTEQILTPPHNIDIASIIVDYSDDYESRVIRIGVDNIISIKPIEKVEDVCPMDCRHEDYCIEDPFAEQKLEYATSVEEEKYKR